MRLLQRSERMPTGSTTVANWSSDELAGQDDPESSAALRQLRTRYDRLRSDYESLLDRLADLEDRLAHEPSGLELTSRPGILAELVVQPLLDLRREYVEAAATINSIVSGLEDLTTRGMKAQHSAAGEEAPAPAAGPEEVEVEVEGGDFGDLLDFQQHLSGIERVSQVSIRSLDKDRATLVVKLHARDAEA